MPAGVKHFVFDAYGTLFDVHSAARVHAASAGESWPRLSEIWRAKQLEYSWIHAGLDAHIPFRECTRRGLFYALKVCGLPEDLAAPMLESYRTLPTFPEVDGVLGALKARGAKLAILSNGDPDMLDDLIAGARLQGVFDAVLSVAAAETFKPHPRVYALACTALNADARQITFLSSNRWDIAGARASGLTPVWVNRARLPDEYSHLPPERTIGDLTALVV